MSGQHLELIVSSTVMPERIDKFLATQFNQISRTRIHQLLEENRILVNGKKIKPSHNVIPGERIEIHIPKPRKVEILQEDIPLDILYEDEQLLIINKPAGMVVHPAFGHSNGTLVNALLYHCDNLSGINGELRPGIVHRLDKDTSGLLVVAKDDYTHRHLSEQFSQRTAQRSYISILWGAFNKSEGRIETKFGRSPNSRKKMAVLSEGKTAITNYKVLEQLPLISFVELKLETGRTHQIRVHMTHIGHPVFSDYDYGGRQNGAKALSKSDRKIAEEYFNCLRRQALHAQNLGFEHPRTGQKVYYTSPVPNDIDGLLTLARQVSDPQISTETQMTSKL